MTRFIFTMLICLACALPSASLTQNRPIDSAPQDLQAVQSVLAHFIRLSDAQALQTPEAQDLFSGEALDWETPSFGKIASSPDKVVLVSGNAAVGRIQWYGENEQVTDFYFYLSSEHGKWKITAMRALALTGFRSWCT